MDKHVTSRMLTCAGGLMSVSGFLMAVCSRPACGGILLASAACMFFAGHSFRLTEDRKDSDSTKEDPNHEKQ